MALTRKPYAAFGLVLYQNICAAGDSYQFDTSTPDGACTTFVTGGRATPIDNITGAALPDYEAGMYFRQYEYPSGTYTMNVSEDLEIFCYAPPANNNVLVSPFNSFSLEINDTVVFPTGTKFFLCRGTLDVGGVTVSGPSQIYVRTSDKTVTAQTKCYGLMLT